MEISEQVKEKKTEKPLRRMMITVAYDGTAYHGFQAQKSGAPTIAGVLNETLTAVFKEPIEVSGGSRTDAGVHSLGNPAVFDTHACIEADRLPYALNRALPDDIRVVKGEEVPADYDPRRSGRGKIYEYRIYNAEIQYPQKCHYAYFSYSSYDIDKMRAAAEVLKGEHDFSSFCSAGAQVLTKVRTIYDISVSEETDSRFPGRDIVIRVSGNGFLYNMVRIIAGTLMEAGKGKYTAQDIKEMLEACDRNAAGPTAPPEGLTLIGYF